MTDWKKQRVVFFDLDGTLHQQNMFSCFLRYLLTHLLFNVILLIPILPIVVIGLLIKGSLARWPISLLLWSITFGHREVRLQELQDRFAIIFRQRMLRFHKVLTHLNNYVNSPNTQVWLITGSPEALVRKVYCYTVFFPSIQLIGSRINRRYGGWVLSLRCLGHEKVIQLEQKIGVPLKLYSGYSDSIHDSPILNYCQYRWFVTPDGKIKKFN